MKKYLQLSFMCLLVLSASVLGSCKNDEQDAGSPSPLLGLEVTLADADSMVQTAITIDQANKAVVISLSKGLADPTRVTCSFDLVKGASLYTPFVTNPVMMDLSEPSGVNINTGKQVVCYSLVAEIDYALKSAKAMAGDVAGVVTVDQATNLIDVYFGDNVVDLTQVNMEFMLSAVTSMVDPATEKVTMDLSADTTYIKLDNEFNGEVIYKLITWGDPVSDYLPVKAQGATITSVGENEYSIVTTSANAVLTTPRFPVGMGSILSFEYKSTDVINNPLIRLDVNNTKMQMYALPIPAADTWTAWTIDMGCMMETAKGAGYSLNMALGEKIGTQFDVRNLTVRDRTEEEIAYHQNATWYMYINKDGGNAATCEDITITEGYPLYKYTPTGGDPYKKMKNWARPFTVDVTQLYYEYRSESSWSWELFYKEVGGAQFYPSNYPSNYSGSNPATSIWRQVHHDCTDIIADRYKGWGSSDSFRCDLDKNTTNVPIYIRNLRWEKKQ
ncbi:MAG: hypothetical protein PHV49_00565 [Alistipes sp.]|nr:hypothetical protein [Alistipes sp.]